MKLRSIAVLAMLTLATRATAQSERIGLWGGLEAGMTPQEALVVLQSKPGVKSASIKKQKDGGERVEIKYSGRGLDIAGKPSNIFLGFITGQLRSVTVKPVSGFGLINCLSSGRSAFDYYHLLLSVKYQQNIAPNFEFNDVSVARMRLGSLTERRYSTPVDRVVEGFSDEKVQVLNLVDLHVAVDLGPKSAFNYSYNFCKGDAGIYAEPSLIYLTKADADARLKSDQDQQRRAVQDLSKDL